MCLQSCKLRHKSFLGLQAIKHMPVNYRPSFLILGNCIFADDFNTNLLKSHQQLVMILTKLSQKHHILLRHDPLLHIYRFQTTFTHITYRRCIALLMRSCILLIEMMPRIQFEAADSASTPSFNFTNILSPFIEEY